MAAQTHAPRLIVTRDPEVDRFELRRHKIGEQDELLSFANYSLDGRVMTLSHVETVPEHRNNDFAAMLMSGVLDEAGMWGWQLRPTCGYAASYINDRADMHHLLAT